MYALLIVYKQVLHLLWRIIFSGSLDAYSYSNKRRFIKSPRCMRGLSRKGAPVLKLASESWTFGSSKILAMKHNRKIECASLSHVASSGNFKCNGDNENIGTAHLGNAKCPATRTGASTLLGRHL